ncbi:hypothetical protein swp_1277 [Shewanella piezotolerans WP3]|uniref:Uncharacterized protein n=1 Tax=Shewanella piezotolerans (strain WP3 / JCM 13877) TaxID=225849 RepID=B8CJH2_SHEPW|nr:hypothetical protein [Shewanella piezotolerans]ACJ28069.1 hypothetical protein swp_1277 [Shewanella piezotolerans WP3]
MRNTYEFDQQAEWHNDFDDSFNDDSKSKRLKQRKKEQRSNNKRSPIEAFSEEHFISESRRR